MIFRDAISAARIWLGRIPIHPSLVLAAVCSVACLAYGQKAPQGSSSRDIDDREVEDLVKVMVASAGNEEQALSKVGAALFVITREDIVSWEANNIPDHLLFPSQVQRNGHVKLPWRVGRDTRLEVACSWQYWPLGFAASRCSTNTR